MFNTRWEGFATSSSVSCNTAAGGNVGIGATPPEKRIELKASMRKSNNVETWRCDYCGIYNKAETTYCGEGTPNGCGAPRGDGNG